MTSTGRIEAAGNEAADGALTAVLMMVLDQQQAGGTGAAPPITEASTGAVCYRLTTEDEWRGFHSAFTGYRTGRLHPWYRCLSVLRGLGAKSAVVETHYVCLDWRSEVATFHAFLDTPRRNFATRIHFFGQPVAEDDVVELSPAQVEAYLGYMVLREADLPMVGRTLIRTPEYMRDDAEGIDVAVTERVHFFGQDLKVVGVPFMQQDDRLAVCAHMVTWMAHYTFYRRGVTERRLISDLIAKSLDIVPMRPGIREGLAHGQVAKLFRELGLGFIDYRSPLTSEKFLPVFDPRHFPRMRARLAALLGPRFDDGATDLSEVVAKAVLDYLEECGVRGEEATVNPPAPALQALDVILEEVVRPYVDSRIPVYLGVPGHAMLLCGIGQRAGRTVFYVHDDMSGPYYQLESLATASMTSLVWESGFAESATPDASPVDVPPKDRVLSLGASAVPRGDDVARSVESILIPTPSRLLLTCSSALMAAAELVLEELAPVNEDGNRGSAERADVNFGELPLEGASAQIMMGVDYKRARCAEARARGDAAAVTAYASVHLAEWVVLVQGALSDGRVLWEVAFDGSSSPTAPRIQLARVGRTLLQVDPRSERTYHHALLDGETLSRLRAPMIVGKYMNTTGEG